MSLCVDSAQLCPTLCDSIDSPGSVHGRFQQEHWSGLPFPSPGNLPNPGVKLASLVSPALAGRFFTTASPGKPVNLSQCVIITQSRPAVCDPMNCSLPGSSVHRILQGRILEWVAISFSGNLPDPVIEPRSPVLAGRFFTI